LLVPLGVALIALAAKTVKMGSVLGGDSSARNDGNRTAAVLWLHGLGDTGNGWRGAFKALGSDVTFEHPTAPRRSVTCNGGATMTSWFDIVSIPLVPSEPDNPKDLGQAIESVHAMLQDLEAKGFESEKIILGGFSQGGLMSLHAGLSYPKPLAGIVSISGWCGIRKDLSWISSAGRQTPVLMSCGDGDPVVDFSITKLSSDLLKSELGNTVEALYPKRGMHQPDRSEMTSVINFMKAHLGIM